MPLTRSQQKMEELKNRLDALEGKFNIFVDNLNIFVPAVGARVALRHVEARPRHPTHAQEPPKKVPITLLSGFLGT